MPEAPSATPPARRVVGVDVARAVALLSMYVAHFSPGIGPGQVLNLSEYLTAALFATLVGVGAALGSVRPAAEAAVAGAVRGAVLIALGVLLEQADSQIVVVLVWLGLLTWLMTWVARWPTVWVALFAALALALSPWLYVHSRDALAAAQLAQVAGESGAGVRVWLLEHLTAGPSYRLTAFAFWASLGVLASRAWLGGRRGDRPAARGARLWVPALLCLAFGLALFGAQVEGAAQIAMYSGTHLELLLDAGLCLGTLGIALELTPLLPRAAARALAATGAMTLTLYTVQIYVSALVVDATGADDHYWMMVTAALGSIALATVWSLALGRTRFALGPLEGVVGVLLAGARRLVPAVRVPGPGRTE